MNDKPYDGCYIGFVLLFHIAFGAHSSGEFSTFGGSCIALFFMMFGDNLLPAFRLIDGSHEWWMRAAADVAGCLYVTVFMGIVLNMSVAIVVDTYKFVSRESNIILLDEPEADELLQTEEMRREQQLQRDALIQSLKEEVVSQLQMIKQLQHKDKRPSVSQL
ncbi:transmembrane protein, putative [Bodo saltans]|uniref:Transmembrane protein, putative n=1 Tax=Bodo saltans TaxID=75058 RepID=A0A0S4J5V7_BODSA|nr:transmembrane protein, putative [Bodo saltans]|eukprot:CUG83876.1 transmembrane protein, putative [Bodo saltans]